MSGYPEVISPAILAVHDSVIHTVDATKIMHQLTGCRISSINSTYMERVSDPEECFVCLSHAEAGMTWNDMS